MSSVKVADEKLGHDFSIHSFHSPTFCEFCGKFLWGMSKQGMKCGNCGCALHEKCIGSFSRACFCRKSEAGLDDAGLLNGSTAFEDKDRIAGLPAPRDVLKDKMGVSLQDKTERSGEVHKGKKKINKGRNSAGGNVKAQESSVSVEGEEEEEEKKKKKKKNPIAAIITPSNFPSSDVILDEIAQETVAMETLNHARQQEQPLNVLSTTPRNFSNFVATVGPVFTMMEFLRDVYFWKSVPISLVAMLSWVLICLHTELILLIPALLVSVYTGRRYRQRAINMYATEEHLISDSDNAATFIVGDEPENETHSHPAHHRHHHLTTSLRERLHISRGSRSSHRPHSQHTPFNRSHKRSASDGNITPDERDELYYRENEIEENAATTNGGLTKTIELEHNRNINIATAVAPLSSEAPSSDAAASENSLENSSASQKRSCVTITTATSSSTSSPPSKPSAPSAPVVATKAPPLFSSEGVASVLFGRQLDMNSPNYRRNLQRIQNSMGDYSEAHNTVLAYLRVLDWSDQEVTLFVLRLTCLYVFGVFATLFFFPIRAIFAVSGCLIMILNLSVPKATAVVFANYAMESPLIKFLLFGTPITLNNPKRSTDGAQAIAANSEATIIASTRATPENSRNDQKKSKQHSLDNSSTGELNSESTKDLVSGDLNEASLEVNAASEQANINSVDDEILAANDIRQSSSPLTNSTLTEAIFENQRWWIGNGWSFSFFPGERGRYSNKTGDISYQSLEDVQAPEDWHWVGTWKVLKDHRGDSDGWEYGSNRWNNFSPSPGFGLFTRRRRWIRTRKLDD